MWKFNTIRPTSQNPLLCGGRAQLAQNNTLYLHTGSRTVSPTVLFYTLTIPLSLRSDATHLPLFSIFSYLRNVKISTTQFQTNTSCYMYGMSNVPVFDLFHSYCINFHLHCTLFYLYSKTFI